MHHRQVGHAPSTAEYRVILNLPHVLHHPLLHFVRLLIEIEVQMLRGSLIRLLHLYLLDLIQVYPPRILPIIMRIRPLHDPLGPVLLGRVLLAQQVHVQESLPGQLLLTRLLLQLGLDDQGLSFVGVGAAYRVADLALLVLRSLELAEDELGLILELELVGLLGISTGFVDGTMGVVVTAGIVAVKVGVWVGVNDMLGSGG